MTCGAGEGKERGTGEDKGTLGEGKPTFILTWYGIYLAQCVGWTVGTRGKITAEPPEVLLDCV